ncbi:MAG: ferredoxin [Pseudomonadota bacterium]
MDQKISDNVQGRFYVTAHCINCCLCPEIAPDNFRSNHEFGHEYVCRQPDNALQEALCREAMDLCPVNAIRDDG